MRRIERLINLIAALLETSRPLTAEQIRDQIAGYDQASHDAFRRAFERDKEALRAMGIPLETVEMSVFGDDPDGYIISKEKYYLPELDLEPAELAALRLAAGALIGTGGQAESGLLKLSVDADEPTWSSPRVVLGADLNAEMPLLGPLYSAVSDRTAVSFDYRSADGPPSKRVVEPYGLVHRRGNWYLVGRDRDKDGVRAFKVSRIAGALSTVEGSFEVPHGFDAEAHVSVEAWEVGGAERVPATVRFSPEFRWWAERNLEGERASEGPEGALDVELEVANLDALVSWVIGFGGEVEVIGPPEARTLVRERIDAAVGAVGG